MIVLTNLGPKSVDLIFYAPNVANLVFFEDRTENCTLERKAYVRGLAGGAIRGRPHDCVVI